MHSGVTVHVKLGWDESGLIDSDQGDSGLNCKDPLYASLGVVIGAARLELTQAEWRQSRI